MAIAVIYDSKGYQPVYICDKCQEVIEEPGEGLFLWGADAHHVPSTVSMYHKMRCDPYQLHQSWDELTKLPRKLPAGGR